MPSNRDNLQQWNSPNVSNETSEIFVPIDSDEDGAAVPYPKTIQNDTLENSGNTNDLDQAWLSSLPPVQEDNAITQRESNGIQLLNSEPSSVKIGENTFKKCNKLNVTGNQTNNIYKGSVSITQNFYGENIDHSLGKSKNKKDKSESNVDDPESKSRSPRSFHTFLPVNVTKWFSKRSKRCIISVSAAVIFTIVLIIVLSVWTAKNSDPNAAVTPSTTEKLPTETTTPIGSTSTPLITSTLPSETTSIEVEFEIISRDEWGARPPKKAHEKNPYLPLIVVISETSTDSCSKKLDCIEKVREVQNRALANESCIDIENHFLVGGDGLAYEGRGWGMLGQITNDNRELLNFGVSFIGDFTRDKATRVQLDAAARLVQLAVQKDLLNDRYVFRVLNDTNPGINLRRVVEGWTH